MGFIKGRHEYLFEQFKTSELTEVHTLISKYLTKYLGDIAEYDDDWKIVKEDGQELDGRLFRTVDRKGIRFNWLTNDNTSIIVSIDLWKDLDISSEDPILNNPDYTIELHGNYVSSSLKTIVNYFKNSISELHDSENGSALEEKSEPYTIIGMDDEELQEIEMDIFEVIKYRVYQTAGGYANSLIITGQSGVGKTFDVTRSLDEMKSSNRDLKYIFIKGGISSSGLYELLFKNNDKLIVFDDCDSVFGSTDSINILKAALDSYPEREISKILKTHFDSNGMNMDEILANHYGDESMCKCEINPINKGKLPKTFVFTGQIIFISNLKGDEIDPTIVTRATAHIDVNLTHIEILERMRKVMESMRPDLSIELKEEVLELIDYLTTKYVTRHPLSIRALVNALNTRVSNDMPVVVNGRRVPMWQVLIKQDMLGKKVIPRGRN